MDQNPDQLSQDTRYVVEFTDLIYAALLSHSLSVLNSIFNDDPEALEIFIDSFLVSFAIMLLIYDWYGEHFLSVHRRTGSVSVIFDFVAFLSYFGILFSANQRSSYLFLFLALRGARGLVLNYLLYFNNVNRNELGKLISWSVSSSLMVLIYLILFFYDILITDIVIWLYVSSVVGVWLVSYAIAIFIERLFNILHFNMNI